MDIKLASFQVLTPGLYTGDPLKISFNYRVTCDGWQCYLGWMTKILGSLDGQTIKGGSAELDRHYATEGGHDGATLEWTGLMPDHDISTTLIFEYKPMTGPPIWGVGHGIEFARRNITIANLSDLTPIACKIDSDCPSGYRCVNGACIPAVSCVDGELQCRGDDRYICQSNEWILYEKDSPACGYEPPPYCSEGETKCIDKDLYRCIGGKYVLYERDSAECGYIPPSPPVDDWLEKYKWWIIGISAAVIIAAAIFIRRSK